MILNENLSFAKGSRDKGIPPKGVKMHHPLWVRLIEYEDNTIKYRFIFRSIVKEKISPKVGEVMGCYPCYIDTGIVWISVDFTQPTIKEKREGQNSEGLTHLFLVCSRLGYIVLLIV